MAGILGEYTELFLEESEDQIEDLNSNLLLLEKDHANPEIINEIFRAAHSLKSSAAFVGLFNLADLSHKMENLLQKIREGKLEVNLTLVNLLFHCFDLIKSVISAVYEGKKIETPFDDMISQLEEYEKKHSGEKTIKTLVSGEKERVEQKIEEKLTPPVVTEVNTSSVINKSTSVVAIADKEPIPQLEIDSDDLRELEEEISGNQKFFDIAIRLKEDTPMKGLRFALILQSVKQLGIIYKSIPEESELESGVDQDWISFILISTKSEEEIRKRAMIDMIDTFEVKQKEVHIAKESVSKQSIREEKADAKVMLKSIKVSSDKLDQLMNNVGELVITNSGFQKIYDDLFATLGEESLITELKFKIDQINRISKDLQTGIMNIRMVPIGTVFSRFSRLVRDLSLETKKKVELVLKGQSTELDKKVIDAIGEPLLHLIRNSVDHGLETPEERIKLNKPEIGIIELNAYQGGSDIMVEIRDDGRGLNKEKILSKALQNNLVSKEEASLLNDTEIYQFIFAAGFSTADKITDISGRGVGMNVVKKLVDDFKGKILISSIPNKGSSITLCFPQALAIIPSILIIMEEEVYAFPLTDVSETIRIHKDQITTLEGHEIINLRGEVLPIYRLNQIIELAEKTEHPEEVPVVIVHYQSRKLGFVVDDLIGKHETVIKSLENNFINIKGFTGASIMGDGTIILVLDIPGLVEHYAIVKRVNDFQLTGEKRTRISNIASFEMNDIQEIFITDNSTNTYNLKLFELKQKEKRKKKKEKKREGITESTIEIKESSEKTIVGQSPEATEISKENKEALPVIKEEVDKVDSIPDIIDVTTTKLEIKEERITSVPDPIYKPSKTEDLHEEFSHHIEKIVRIEEKNSKEKEQASKIIQSFIEQKNERLAAINSVKKIDITLSQEEMRKLESVMNSGMMNAGMVLSQLIGKEVELLMPEMSLTDKGTFISEIRHDDEFYFGLRVRMSGKLHGNLLMMFSEENGKKIAREMLKVADIGEKKALSEDAMSVLSEISNIVCSSLINSLSNKTKEEILPSVPELVTGSFGEVLDIVKPEHTKFLVMHTEFNYIGNHLLGLLFFLPDFDELVDIVAKI